MNKPSFDSVYADWGVDEQQAQDVVERVAKALAREYWEECDEMGLEDERHSPCLKWKSAELYAEDNYKCFYNAAKAAIAAMGGVEASSGNSASHSSALGSKDDNLAPPAQSKVSIVEKALANAAEILANFKGEPDATKLEQWQACYAKLFTQMNELVQSTKPVSVKHVYEKTNWFPHIVKQILDAAGVKYRD